MKVPNHGRRVVVQGFTSGYLVFFPKERFRREGYGPGGYTGLGIKDEVGVYPIFTVDLVVVL